MKLVLSNIVILLLLISPGFAQKPVNLKFDRITSENIVIEKGLSQNLINCILQDHDGYMWFGTWDGLNRYDGYEFKIFGKKDGLSNSSINTIIEDNKNQLWLGTEDGLNILNLNNYDIIVHRHDHENSNSISNDFINHIYKDKDGYYWICTSKGLNKYDPVNKAYTRYYFSLKNADSINSNWINRAYQDNSGGLWIGTRHGLFCFNPDEKVFLPYFHDGDNDNSISSNWVLDIKQTVDGAIWIGTANGLNRLDKEKEEFTRYYNDPANEFSISNDFIYCIYQDSNGLIWIGTENKLNLYNPERDDFFNYCNTSNNTSLSNNTIYSIYEDGLRNLWVGTYKGINKIDKYSSKFEKFEKTPDNPKSLSSNIVFAIIKDNQDFIWLGTSKGLNKFNRKSGDFELINYQFDNQTNLSDVRIRALRQDSKGNIWIGTEALGLLKYNPENEKFILYQFEAGNQNSLSGNTIYFIIEDSNNNIWVATSNGLSKLNPETGNFTNYKNDPIDKSTISNNNIWHVYEDRDGNIWASTDLGINKLNLETNIFTRYINDHSRDKTISSNKVFSIFQDSDDEYWIGTMGGGLNHFDPVREEFLSFNEDDGLPNNVVYNIVEDLNGHLWLNTNWGLSKFIKSDSSFVNYDIKDGLQGNEFNGGAFYKSPEGELFFGGMNGFNAFHPDDIGHNTRIPKIVITNFKIFNQDQTIKINSGDTITLDYTNNFFSFEFSALDFANPSKNKYMYKLGNYDKDWIERDADRRIAEYANVSPGTYTFNLKASNNDGIWNDEEFIFTLVIPPPWYRQWWFRISFLVFVISIIWFIIYRRFRTVKLKNEVEKKMLNIEKQLFDIEQKALRLQMNPHFIFNSLNAIQSFIIANNTDKAIHYLSKFSQLMRLTLSNSRETIIPVKDEVKALTYFMDIEKLRFDDKFNYTIKIDPRIDEEFMAIPPMILQPYVENAILHGLNNNDKKGHLQIDIKLQKDTIFCIIEDNGIGREEARKIKEASGIKRESRGMIITKERLELLNNQNKDKYSVKIIDLKSQSGKANGTRVEIKMLFEDI